MGGEQKYIKGRILCSPRRCSRLGVCRVILPPGFRVGCRRLLLLLLRRRRRRPPRSRRSRRSCRSIRPRHCHPRCGLRSIIISPGFLVSSRGCRVLAPRPPHRPPQPPSAQRPCRARRRRLQRPDGLHLLPRLRLLPRGGKEMREGR